MRTPEDVKRQLREVEDRTGPWTAHNIEVAPGVFTRGGQLVGDERRVRAVAQLVAHLTDRSFDGLRVLDLGALEGGFGIEFALRGAEVVFLEGREHNADKIRFAVDALAIKGASVRTEDVRALSRKAHGQFDVVLCLGLLYHLDQAGLFGLLREMTDVCTHMVVVETQIAYEDAELRRYRRDEFCADPTLLTPMREVEVDGHTYRGRDCLEHPPGSSRADRLARSWASLDNENSLWLTRTSLINALVAKGFGTVLEQATPWMDSAPDRHLVIALAGEPVRLKSTSLRVGNDFELIPEHVPSPDADELDQLRAELAQTRLWLDMIQKSASWRLTSPLRRIKRIVAARRS